MAGLDRRDFLKLLGMAGLTAAGCSSETPDKLIPFNEPAADIVTGKPTWYASTCRECPAGCGLLAKNLDGRVIKLEGNPRHPVNRGALCPRGQAALHGLYNPDRFDGPQEKNEAGLFEPISWEVARTRLADRLRLIAASGRGQRVAMIAPAMTGSLKDLAVHYLASAGSKNLILYEALAYEPLRAANAAVFGLDSIPLYRFDRADFILSLGAGFLESWLSNVEYARQFSDFHAPSGPDKHFFAYVGPRQSLTAAGADFAAYVTPGNEYLVALGMLRILLEDGRTRELPPQVETMLQSAAGSVQIQDVVSLTGVSEATLRALAHKFSEAKVPLAVADGLPYAGPNAVAAAVAANLLCQAHPGASKAIDFDRASVLSGCAAARSLHDLTGKMKRGDIDLLLLWEANPVFTLPGSWEFHKHLEAVPLVVSFSNCPDETTALAHLVLPAATPLESWGDFSPRPDVIGLSQPVMGPVFDSRSLGDLFISTGRMAFGGDKFPWIDHHHLLKDAWRQLWEKQGGGETFEAFWLESLKRGGWWAADAAPDRPLPVNSSFKFAWPKPVPPTMQDDVLHFTAYPTIQFYDGRGANRPWLQEMPDPMTQVTWGAWVEIHPDTAQRLGIQSGDMLRVKSPYGEIEAPALPIFTVPPDTAAMPIGQGHSLYGRFAGGLPANPLHLFPPETDSSGGLARPPIEAALTRTGRNEAIAHTDGHWFQENRGLIQQMSFPDYRLAESRGARPEIDLPLPEGHNPKKDIYPPHPHVDYRWCMVVDLDRCNGCGACVVACYAENNVALVGKKRVLEGREMAWLRIERYLETPGEQRAAFLPMLCQHCDQAPCEAVCPLFAPQHGPEGLNNQVYNRCLGTRDCSQNDPYKVRRFNFFTYTRPKPLNLQLNPEVTVRQKGVMEKCSFCVQRIVAAKAEARNQDRKVRDGDFTTACAQTCPTGAMIFGNLLDPESRVSKLINDPRAYQVLRRLNTKPAVIYLKKLTLRLA